MASPAAAKPGIANWVAVPRPVMALPVAVKPGIASCVDCATDCAAGARVPRAWAPAVASFAMLSSPVIFTFPPAPISEAAAVLAATAAPWSAAVTPPVDATS